MDIRKAFSLFFVFLFSIEASANAGLFDSKKNPIKGKFAIYSFREGKHVNDSALYIVKDQSIKKISEIAGGPVWSPDGSRLLANAESGNTLYIFKDDGTLIETIKTKYRPKQFDWIPGRNAFIYAGSEKLNDQWDEINHLYIYDLDTHTEKEIFAFDNNQIAFSLRVSPDGEKILFGVGPGVGKNAEDVLGVVNLQTGKVRKYIYDARAMGWIPNSNNVVVWTNTKEDGSKINERFGVIGKINVKSGAFEIIRDRTNFGLQTSLSKDGQFIYYIRDTDNGGKAVFVQPLNSHEEYQVTTPVLIPALNAYSQDSEVSWYQS